MITAAEIDVMGRAAYGPLWQSALAREIGVDSRTVRRWAQEGVGKLSTAANVRAHLLSRRVITLPPPAGDDPDARDEQARDIADELVSTLLGAAAAIGWHPAEITTALLTSTADAIARGAGPPAASDILRAMLDLLDDRTPR